MLHLSRCNLVVSLEAHSHDSPFACVHHRLTKLETMLVGDVTAKLLYFLDFAVKVSKTIGVRRHKLKVF